MRNNCCITIKKGDRVRLANGPEKGKTGTIQEINDKYQVCLLLDNGIKAYVYACDVENVEETEC